MKFDKETIIAIVVCGILLIGWEPLCRKMGWITEPEKTAPRAVAAPAKPEVSSPAGEQKNIVLSLPPVAPTTANASATAALPVLPPQVLENDSLSVSFDPNRGCIGAVTMKKFLNADKSAPVILDNDYNFQPGALAVTLGETNPAKVVKIIDNSKVDDRTYRLTRQFRNAAGQEIVLTQKWTLLDNYAMQYTFSLQSGDKPFQSDVALSLGDLPSWSKLSGDYLRTDVHEFAFMTESGEYDTLAVSAKPEKISGFGDRTVKWAALNNKYFAVILVPEKPGRFLAKRIALDDSDKLYSASLQLGCGAVDLARPVAVEYSFRYYVGPKEIDYLNPFEPGTGKLIHYSWGPINVLAKWLLWCLERLRALCGSYGVSIILLTLIVRTLFYPVTLKANASMQKMQAVQPRIKEMREKYKDNPQLLNTKMMELYRTEKINPFGGCLPILLQIPVFFALYAALDGALQLRQVPFLWSSDLAGPDTVFSCPLPFSLFGIANFHLNPLVIAMTVFMVIQQHITPNSMEPTQKKMMAMMPFMMLIFLYELPSGLTLYWTVSNIFSIVQLLIQQRMSKKSAAATGN